MNLVKGITDQLSSDALAKLCSTLGVDVQSIESAIAVAVPSMLAGLGGLASEDEGLSKLTSTLGSLDDTMFGNFNRMLSGDTSGIVIKGRALWTGLFGHELQSSLATAINRFTGLSPGNAVKLLECLTPLVFGRVASQWRNQGGTPDALKRLFGSQQKYIDDALPSGFSLDDIRDLPRMTSPSRVATPSAAEPTAASKSLTSSLIPLALVVAAVVLLWSYLRYRSPPQEAGARPAPEATEEVVAWKPVMPDQAGAESVSQIGLQSTTFILALDRTLQGIEAAPTAEVALPNLQVLDRRIDDLGAAFAELPPAGRSALDKSIHAQIEQAKQHASRILELSDLNKRLQPLILQIVRKLDALNVGEPPT